MSKPTPAKPAKLATPGTTLDKAQWAQVLKALSCSWGSVKLLVDGLSVTLEVRQSGPLQYVVMPFVDGFNHGRWILEDCPERRLLCRPVKRLVYSHARIRKITQGLSQRIAAALLKRAGVDPAKTHTGYLPYWSSPRALITHLKKHATSVQLVDQETAHV